MTVETRITIMASLSVFASALCGPAHAADQPNAEPATVYTCDNGMSLDVAYLQVRGHGAIEVTFPSGRDLGVKATSLLPATQTGSGVRYASDITEFHVKGNTARFATRASAKSEAIANVECNRVIPDEERKPATQAARAGQYFLLHPQGPLYNRVETVCFADDGQNFLALNSAADGQVVTYNSSESLKYATVSGVDAGAGQRRYTLTSVKDAQDQVTLHFIAPGMREANLPSATAGLSSISQDGERRACVDGDRIVYAGTNTERGITITLQKDGLAFRSFGQSKGMAWPEMRGGYIMQGEDKIVFEFLSKDSRMRVSTNRGGTFFMTPQGDLRVPQWELETPIANRSESAVAYFIANADAIGDGVPTLDRATIDLLDSLSLCNHLTGEASEDAERNAQLKQKWETASCDSVPKAYATTLAKADKQTSLYAYLANHSPNWL